MLIEQLRAVDLDRLDEFVGRIAPEKPIAIDEAIELVLVCSHCGLRQT